MIGQTIQDHTLISTMIIESGAGIAIADSSGSIVERCGTMVDWLPPVGGNLHDAAILCGLEDDISALRRGVVHNTLSLPAIEARPSSGEKVDVRVMWSELTSHYMILATPAEHSVDLQRQMAQTSREMRILEEKVSRQDRALAETNRLLAIFVTRVPAAVAMLDAQLCYLHVSERWSAEFGTVVLGQELLGGMPAMTRRWRKAFADCVLLGEPRSGLEKQKLPDGTIVWRQWDLQPWFNGADTVSGVLVCMENITRIVEQSSTIRQKAQRLRAANVDLRRFSLAISHDLRAPVRQIGAFASFLEEDHASSLDSQGKAYLTEVRYGAERMGRMIDSLLKYARVSATPVVLKAVDLNSVLDTTRRLLAVDLARASATIITDQLPIIGGDEVLLTAVFQNLVENSLKYCGVAQPVIRVSAEFRETSWHVRVQDNGVGISREVSERAFDLFQRLGRDQSVPGTGVGLSICKRVIELHGGRIWIDFEAVPGLCLVFTLPQWHLGRKRAQSPQTEKVS